MSLLAGSALLPVTSAHAADALKFGPPPAWVVPQTIPTKPPKPSEAPVAVLLNDSQERLEPGKTTAFVESAVKIQTAEGLAVGNMSLPWDPATETITINKLNIIRDGKVIDVLAGGQKFTVMRRETNLEIATLDGALTANIQPEGLQVGDVIDIAATDERIDPVLKNHVETTFGGWNGVPIELGHVRLSWPSTTQLFLRQSADLQEPHRSTAGGFNVFELSQHTIEPLLPPKGAPLRFQLGRFGEVTDFNSWSDLADLMMPLYRQAAVIPASGPLRDEVEAIRKSARSPNDKAQRALGLVQDKVRYVALEMGTGGLVPAAADTTWSRRFGDCKGKSALLLALLHELGIEAEPVIVHHSLGDMLPERLPMVAYFDHVLVRAHIGGKDYWLDGTRTGDTDLDSIETPDFRWGLPLAQHAELVHMVPRPLDMPNVEHRVDIDASAGVYAPAPITIQEIYRGDTAVGLNSAYSAATAVQRDETLRRKAKSYFDDFTVSSSSVQFDKAKREMDLTIRGTAKLGWKDSWFDMPTSSIGFDSDFYRAAGPFHDVPIAVGYPSYVKDTATIRLPHGFAAQQELSAPVHETLAGVEYNRSETVAGDVLKVDSSERSIVPEVSYKDALAAESQLRKINKDDVYLSNAVSYSASDKDLAALPDTTPDSADDYVDRGDLYLDRHKYDEAIADYTAALKLEPKQKWALADRGMAHVWKHDFDEAEKDLSAAAALDPNNSVVSRARGLMAQFNGDCPKAIAFYTQSLVQKSGNPFALGHRAECEATASKTNEALADSAQALKSDPAWVDLHLLRANLFMIQGKRDLVAAEAETLTRENPTSDSAWVAAGRTYAALGQREKAMQAFDRALAIKPAAYIYVNRAWSRPFTDKGARLADLDMALRIEPNNPDALAEKAEELATNGDYKAALQLYDQITAAGVKNSSYAVRRAVFLFKAGDTTQATKLFAQQRADAKTAMDFNRLCWSKATAGILLDEALQECREALKRQPDSGAIIDSMAFVELRLGKVDEAVADYDRAIAKNAGAASYMGRAIAYARKGDKSRAETDRAEALKLDADAQTRFEEYGLKFDGASASVAGQVQQTAVAEP